MNIHQTIAEAHAGRMVAQAILGIYHFHGNHVEQNYGEAFRWLTLVAERGAPRALYHLGLIYEQGLHGEVNPERAFDCFHRAAKREEVSAYIHVARMLRYGLGTDRDEKAAAHWYASILDEVERGYTFEYADEAKKFTTTPLKS